MNSFRMRFIICKLTDEEMQALKNGEPIISKMLLTQQDYRVFHYKGGNQNEVETQDGNRIWTTSQTWKSWKMKTVLSLFSNSSIRHPMQKKVMLFDPPENGLPVVDYFNSGLLLFL